MANTLRSNALRLLPAFVTLFVASTAHSAVGTTLENLKSAYGGETEAVSKYTQYAKAAELEHMAYEASLFTAISRSEAIHARNHLRVLHKYRVAVTPSVYTGKVGTTMENVTDSRLDETDEYTVMYPAYIAKAKSDGFKAAVKSFTYAMEAEKGHAAFFAEGEKNEKAGTVLPAVQFYVCSECGQTFAQTEPAQCPICGKKLGKSAAVK